MKWTMAFLMSLEGSEHASDRNRHRARQGLVRTIEALGTVESSGWLERWQARLLQAGYEERLRALVAALPSWATEEILSASQHIESDRAAVSFSEN